MTNVRAVERQSETPAKNHRKKGKIMFEKLIEALKANPKKIVFTEGEDPRILEAASRL